MHTFKTLALLISCSLLFGCSSFSLHNPFTKTYKVAQEPPLFLDWHQSIFLHGVWRNPAFVHAEEKHQTNPIGELNIYIHGDGIPWTTRYQIASDPSPKKSMTWALFLKDPQPSLFISRPCYFGSLDIDSNCSQERWGSGRYSAEIVASFKEAIIELRRQQGAIKLNLIGFSGGGALAMLIAAELNDDIQKSLSVITIAANLDIEAWTTFHDYSPLTLSLNPRDLRPLNVQQHHFCGSRDNNIPASIVEKFFARQGGKCRSVDASHTRGWLKKWPLLKRDTSNE